jgi:tetratricopeptide (TPR) repeat protein
LIYKRQGDYPTAMNYYLKTLEIQLKSLPENDPDIVRTYWNIGNLCCCQGNQEKAREEWQKALDIASTSLPSNDPLIVGLLKKLSSERD